MNPGNPNGNMTRKRRRCGPAEPRYRVIRNTLRDKILQGAYGVGDQLPSENQLMTAFDVSRVTVRQALHQLQRENLIFSQRGKGYFVARPKSVQNLDRLMGLGETMAESGLDTYSKVVDVGDCAADRAVAQALGLGTGITVTRLHRIRYIHDQPVSDDVSFFPSEIGRRLRDHDLERNDVFVLLEERLKIPLGVADLKIDVNTADARLAKSLDTAPGAPVLCIERLTADETGRPIDFEYIRGRGDAYQFRIRVPRW